MDLQQVVKKNLCLGCGICSISGEGIKMRYSQSRGMNIPVLSNDQNYVVGKSLCPGSGYDIIKEGADRFSSEGDYTVELGCVHSSYAAYSENQAVLNGASSGGVMSQLLLYLLDEKIVDKVAVTRFVYTNRGPRTETFLTSNVSEVLESQGSKYCPVDVSEFLSELATFKGRVAYVGTPCQIAGIRKLQRVKQDLGEKILITIANFCGGFKSFNNVKKLSERHDIDFNSINYFRFRGGGQPGTLLMSDSSGRKYEAPYPSYTGFTGYSKVLRCHLCIDATGELADISCGDAWLDKYKNDTKAWSIVLCRSRYGNELIKEMTVKRLVYAEDLEIKDVVQSQRINIQSKKVRQLARVKLYRLLGYTIPQFDGGVYLDRTSMIFEIKVFFNHRFKEILEGIGCYKLFRKILKKAY